jgi:hypothetical protein
VRLDFLVLGTRHISYPQQVAIYRVRFHSEVRASTHILFCEFMNMPEPSATSDIDFQSDEEVGEKLSSVGFRPCKASLNGTYGLWCSATTEQLHHLGFASTV